MQFAVSFSFFYYQNAPFVFSYFLIHPNSHLLLLFCVIQTLSYSIVSDSPKMLEVKRNPRISIFPKQKNISFRKCLPFEIVPGALDTDRLFFSSYINGGTFETTFVMRTTATILPGRCEHTSTRITITS